MCRCRMNNCMNNNNSNMIDVRMIDNNMQDDDECECGFDEESVFPENYMFGQSYVPIQRMTTTFRPCTGLKMGTIFPELVDPYTAGQSMEEDQFLRCSNEVKEGCNSGM